MKKLPVAFIGIAVFMLMLYAFKAKENYNYSELEIRSGYYKGIAGDISHITRSTMTCEREDCEGEGAICAASSFQGCGEQSECTCLEYSTPWVDQIAQCLGIPELTPDIWSQLTDEERNLPCVVNVLEPHLIPDPEGE